MDYVAYSCCKQNKGMNEMNDAHDYEIQVQICESNTWGVTDMNSKLPNQITVPNGSGRSGSAIQKNGGKAMLARSGPLLGTPTVGVRTREGPKPTSEFVLRAP
jgi:hypothetical protein